MILLWQKEKIWAQSRTVWEGESDVGVFVTLQLLCKSISTQSYTILRICYINCIIYFQFLEVSYMFLLLIIFLFTSKFYCEFHRGSLVMKNNYFNIYLIRYHIWFFKSISPKHFHAATCVNILLLLVVIIPHPQKCMPVVSSFTQRVNTFSLILFSPKNFLSKNSEESYSQLTLSNHFQQDWAQLPTH